MNKPCFGTHSTTSPLCWTCQQEYACATHPSSAKKKLEQKTLATTDSMAAAQPVPLAEMRIIDNKPKPPAEEELLFRQILLSPQGDYLYGLDFEGHIWRRTAHQNHLRNLWLPISGKRN